MATVSIILPVYNRAPRVGRAISSVLAQNVEDWELLVVDDGSTDGSSEVARVYGRHDPRITILSLPHRGRVAAREQGVQRSSAAVVTFLDSDDFYESDHLYHQLNHFFSRGNLALLLGVPKVVGNPYVTDVYNLDQTIPVQECAVQGTFFVARPVFEKVGKIPAVPFGEDVFFYERVRELGLPTEKKLMSTYVLDRTRKSSPDESEGD